MTLKRLKVIGLFLVREGRSEDDAKSLIGSVIAVEIYEVLKRREPFNPERFVQALNRLPERSEK